jgi:hypothetical protein
MRHHLLICERALLEPLGDVTTTAIAQRDLAPLAKFWRVNRTRYTAYDQVRVARDGELVAATRATLARLEQSRYAASSNAHAVIVEARWLAPVEYVSRTAQRALAIRVARLDLLLATRGPDPLVDQEVAGVRAALVALDSCDLQATLATAPHASYEAIMQACCTIGLDGDHGLGSLTPHTLAPGKPLYATPYISATDAPSPELATRVTTRFATYAAAGANELFAEDARAVCGMYLTPPSWTTGAALREAADYATAIAKQSEARHSAAFLRVRELVLEAARGDLAMLEWIATS